MVFDTKLLLHKHKLKKQLIQHYHGNKLVCIKKAKSQKLFGFFSSWEENEFSVDGKMYDVVRKEITGDSILYYCFADSEENELLFEINNWLRQSFSISFPLNETQKNVFIKLFELKYIIEKQAFKCISHITSLPIEIIQFGTVERRNSTSAPPPEMG